MEHRPQQLPETSKDKAKVSEMIADLYKCVEQLKSMAEIYGKGETDNPFSMLAAQSLGATSLTIEILTQTVDMLNKKVMTLEQQLVDKTKYNLTNPDVWKKMPREDFEKLVSQVLDKN